MEGNDLGELEFCHLSWIEWLWEELFSWGVWALASQLRVLAGDQWWDTGCVWPLKWSHSVVSDSLWPPWTLSLPGSSIHGIFPGKNTGVHCHFLLRGIFPTHGSNPGLPHSWQTSVPCKLVSAKLGGGWFTFSWSYWWGWSRSRREAHLLQIFKKGFNSTFYHTHTHTHTHTQKSHINLGSNTESCLFSLGLEFWLHV